MIPLPSDPNASYFWSLAPHTADVDWLLLLALVLLPFGGAVLGYWAGWWARGRDQANETAPGVTPAGDFPWFDPRSVREAEQAAEIEAMVGGGR